MKRVALGLVALAGLAAEGRVMAQGQVPPLPVDSAVRIGKLDNGLTYFIRRNKHPEGRAHFYIAQKVGSMQEEENQCGLAHFLEHIAFNGTKHFPGKGIMNYLESIGVKFGTNLNAYTGFDETVYTIMDAPTARQATVDSCLLILHDWSQSISLLDKEIDDERGVIQEEWRSRNTGNYRVIARLFELAFPDNKYGQRMPIGTMEVVRGFKYDELRAYYKKWYRTDLQGLIIVGDIDPDRVEATIKKQFADVKKPENAAERIYVPVADHKGVLGVVATDKEAVGTRVGVSFKTDVTPPEVRASQFGVLEDYIKSLITSMISERFSDIIKKPNAPFIGANAGFGSFLVARTKDAFDFDAVAADGKYAPALKALTNEIERIRQYGFTAGEYDRAKKDYLVNLKKLYNERDKRKNEEFAEEYKEYFLRGGYIPGIEVEYQLINQVADQLPLEAINQAVKQAITEDNVLVSLTGPEKEGISYPTGEALAEEFKKYRSEKVEPLKDAVSTTKLIEQKPKGGKVVKEEKTATKFGSVVWTLSNGVKVIVKPTTFKEDEIRFSALRPGGRSTFAVKDALESRALNQVINLGGLAQFDDQTLSKVLSGRLASVTPRIEETREVLSGSSTAEDLETLLQLVYLNFTAKRSDREAFTAWKEKAIESVKMREANPMASVSDSIGAALYPGDKRYQSLTVAEYNAVNYERAMQLYKERFGDAAGFQFFFVGNVDLAKLRPLVETYLGALPVTKRVHKADLAKLARIRQGNYKNHYTKAMQTPMGLVVDVWPGTLAANQKNRLSMSILGEVLEQVYTEVIREREGGTYGASVNAMISYEPKDEANLFVFFQTDPDKADRLNSLVKEELEKIVKQGVDQTKFDKVIANLKKNYDENQKENAYWIDLLETFYHDKRDSYSDYMKTLNAITPQEVAGLLSQLLGQKRYIEVVMLPEATKDRKSVV